MKFINLSVLNLKKKVTKYNNNIHRTINMKPVDVKPDIYDVKFLDLYKTLWR